MEKTKLKESNKYILVASIAGFISALVTLIMGIAGHTYLLLIDAVFIFLLSLGILIRKSRSAAIVLVAYFFISKLAQLYFMTRFRAGEFPKILPFLLVSLVFLICFIMGIKGTYDYHRTAKTKIIPKNVIYKTLISIAYFIITYIIVFLILLALRNSVPVSKILGTLLLFIPAEVMMALSFFGYLPFSNRFPFVNKNIS